MFTIHWYTSKENFYKNNENSLRVSQTLEIFNFCSLTLTVILEKFSIVDLDTYDVSNSVTRSYLWIDTRVMTESPQHPMRFPNRKV